MQQFLLLSYLMSEKGCPRGRWGCRTSNNYVTSTLWHLFAAQCLGDGTHPRTSTVADINGSHWEYVYAVCLQVCGGLVHRQHYCSYIAAVSDSGWYFGHVLGGHNNHSRAVLPTSHLGREAGDICCYLSNHTIKYDFGHKWQTPCLLSFWRLLPS